jgi:hypothetical protein
VSLIGFIAVVYGFLADIAIFHSPIVLKDVCGALLILAVTAISTVYKLK